MEVVPFALQVMTEVDYEYNGESEEVQYSTVPSVRPLYVNWIRTRGVLHVKAHIIVILK